MKTVVLGLIVVLAVAILSIFLYFQFSSCGIAPWGCGDYPTEQEIKTHKISVGDGPEDLALDMSTGVTRIIVSCTERRSQTQEIGGFHHINVNDYSSSQFTIVPANLQIFPHGIDVVTIDSIPFLYAISHHDEEDETKHKIFRFEIKGDTLVQDQSYVLEDALLTGPNDIDVLEDGSFYVSNPMPSNDPNESTKAILGIKNGTVLHYDGQGRWMTVLKDMCYPNGIWVDQNTKHLIIANGGCRAVERYPINNSGVDVYKQVSTVQHEIDIPIGDNLMLDDRGTLWTAAHPCPLKFVAHAQDATNKSPMQIFAIDPTTMKTNLVFQNNGELISAASTVIHIDKQLFISQVFDPFVLVVDGLSI